MSILNQHLSKNIYNSICDWTVGKEILEKVSFYYDRLRKSTPKSKMVFAESHKITKVAISPKYVKIPLRCMRDFDDETCIITLITGAKIALPKNLKGVTLYGECRSLFTYDMGFIIPKKLANHYLKGKPKSKKVKA